MGVGRVDPDEAVLPVVGVGFDEEAGTGSGGGAGFDEVAELVDDFSSVALAVLRLGGDALAEGVVGDGAAGNQNEGILVGGMRGLCYRRPLIFIPFLRTVLLPGLPDIGQK